MRTVPFSTTNCGRLPCATWPCQMADEKELAASDALLTDAERASLAPGADIGETYFKITRAQIRMITQGRVEPIDWLLETAVHSRSADVLSLYVDRFSAKGGKPSGRAVFYDAGAN